jgi:hypothetical protein
MLLLHRYTYTGPCRVSIVSTSGHHLDSVFGLVYIVLDVLHAVVVIIEPAGTVCFRGLLEVRFLRALDHVALMGRSVDVVHVRECT